MEILISFQGAWSARGGSPQTNGKQRGMLEGRGRWSKRNLDGHKYRCQDVYRQLERGQIFPPPAGFPYATLMLHRIGCVHHFQVSLTGGPFTNKRPAIVPSEDCFLNLVVDSFTKGWGGGQIRPSFEGKFRGRIYLPSIRKYQSYCVIPILSSTFVFVLSFPFLFFTFFSLFEFARIRPIQSIGTIITRQTGHSNNWKSVRIHTSHPRSDRICNDTPTFPILTLSTP